MSPGLVGSLRFPAASLSLFCRSSPDVPFFTSLSFSFFPFRSLLCCFVLFHLVFQAGCKVGSLCPIAITVYGRRASNFTIVVSTGHYPTPLENGVPLASFVPQGAYRYFDFTTLSSLTDVRFIITPESGDPDLVVSLTQQQPTIGCSTADCWIAAGIGPEMITIKSSDPHYQDAPALYNIGVYGWAGNASFTITAVEMTDSYSIDLEDGQPQYQQSEPHAFTYFTYDVPVSALDISPVDFLTTPLQGDVDLFISVSGAYPQVHCVTLDPTAPQGCSEYGVVAGTYAFSSVGSNVADFVTVPVNAQTPGNKIIVGVLATTPDESRFSQLAPPSTFSVVAVSGNGILELQDGLAVVGSVAKSAYKYYSYEISNWGMDLSIVGQATVGSIDLFVSEVAQNPGPSANTWNSTGRGGVNSRDVIYLSALDIASHCPFLIFGIPCTLYIAVKGSDWVNPLLTPAYSLVASLSGNPSFPYYLSSGRSLNTVIQPSSYQYFYSNLNIDQSQSVYLIAQDWSESGTTAMWAALGTTGGAGAFPQPSNNFKADFFSSDLGGFNRIVIAPPTVTADGPVAVPFGNTPEQNEHRRLTVERLASLKDGKAVFKVDAAVARRRLSAATEEDMNSHGRTALWAQRYNPVRARALAAEARALDEASGLVGAAPYCTSCPLYVTLGSRSATQDSDISLYYGAGATFTPLEDDVPFPAIMDGNGTTYFSFAVPDKTADITITVQPFFGSVVAYVIVQSPLRPYRTAASTFWQYKIQPDVGSNSITIPKTDSSFCVSPDGASSGAPCTYTIAVVSVDPTSSFAYFNVLATRDASGSGNVIELLDGEPQDGVVPEGQGLFYQFNPTPYNSNLAVAPVLINAAATVGDITIYVTNSYTPGLSPTTDLPGPTNSRCQWTTKATDPNNILIQSTDPCFNSFAETYTIGIYGSSGIAQFQNKFAVTAAFNQPYLVQKLEFGQPATNQFVADATTRVFVFDLADPTKDISVSVTPTYGDVTLMVAKHSDFANPPICKQAAPGAQAACSGWTWLATGVAGASALSIPAAVPCTPYSGADLQAPLVNQTSCATDYRFGRFWLSVWAWKDAEVSVSVNVGGQPILLTDGEPQMIMTSSVVLCKVRDVNTGLCVPNGQQRFPGQAAFARIVMPAGLSPYDGDLMLERVCNEDQQGNCGQSAVAYINSCSASNCTMADAFPSIYDYDASYTLNNDAAGAINLPMLPAARTVPGDDVVYHVAVYPTCGSGNNNPGVNCQPALLRLTWAGDSQPQRVPVDCNSPGRVCTIPTQDVGNAPNGVRRYIGYAPLNSNGATSTISVTARACMGDVVLSLCNGQAGSKCSPINNPSPSNNDGTASTASVANGVVSLSMTPSAAAQYYFGVSKASGSSFSSPTYNLVLGSAVGPTFVVPGNAPSAIRDTTVGNTVSVAFSLPSLNTNGNPGNANGVVYTAYLFPVTAVPRGYNMGATCGVSAFLATYSNNPASVITYNANSNAFTVKGLTPSQSYMLVITAQCELATTNACRLLPLPCASPFAHCHCLLTSLLVFLFFLYLSLFVLQAPLARACPPSSTRRTACTPRS